MFKLWKSHDAPGPKNLINMNWLGTKYNLLSSNQIKEVLRILRREIICIFKTDITWGSFTRCQTYSPAATKRLHQNRTQSVFAFTFFIHFNCYINRIRREAIECRRCRVTLYGQKDQMLASKRNTWEMEAHLSEAMLSWYCPSHPLQWPERCRGI